MSIDLEYYLNNQLKNAVVSLLEPIYPRSEQLFQVFGGKVGLFYGRCRALLCRGATRAHLSPQRATLSGGLAPQTLTPHPQRATLSGGCQLQYITITATITITITITNSNKQYILLLPLTFPLPLLPAKATLMITESSQELFLVGIPK